MTNRKIIGPAVTDDKYSFVRGVNPVWYHSEAAKLLDQAEAIKSPAPRIPRFHRNPDSPDGTAYQGRVHVDDSKYELPPILREDDILYALMLVSLATIFSIGLAALCGIGWTDVIQWLALVGRAVTWSAT